MKKAILVFEDKTVFEGLSFGANGKAFGELSLFHDIVGYQEALTNSSNAQKIILFTTPHIGNTGVNAEDGEGGKIVVSGVIARDAARKYSNFRADGSLNDDLLGSQTVAICGVDTRALTRKAVTMVNPIVAIATEDETLSIDELHNQLINFKNQAQKESK